MNLRVEIDPSSGFCGGVIRAINGAEEFLDGHKGAGLLSLGAIVHNEEELSRLGGKGLITIESLPEDGSLKGRAVLIRAHGVPPKVYKDAEAAGAKVIDCTCPVVLKLQKDIREAHGRGRVMIFGKIGHPEVLGLVGQVNSDACVFENAAQLEEILSKGLGEGKIILFSQTTMNPSEYETVCRRLREAFPDRVEIHDTICSQVASRHRKLSEFASGHDVIIFVSGKASSNGKVLCELCQSVNPRTHHICSTREIERKWFRDNDNVGVCGATSTPQWLLEQVRDEILKCAEY